MSIAATDALHTSEESREAGLGDLLGPTRLFEMVPIAREMMLNHVAEHEPGLPSRY
ncbi:MAG TPA: hypothetical protein VGX51_09845 [Solirubrobacteraceae bacterium]|nr:hypothetical protein [Solirubrobacteraceae bacterium]